MKQNLNVFVKALYNTAFNGANIIKISSRFGLEDFNDKLLHVKSVTLGKVLPTINKRYTISSKMLKICIVHIKYKKIVLVVATNCGRYFFQNAHCRKRGPLPTCVVFIPNSKYCLPWAVCFGHIGDPIVPGLGSLKMSKINKI